MAGMGMGRRAWDVATCMQLGGHQTAAVCTFACCTELQQAQASVCLHPLCKLVSEKVRLLAENLATHLDLKVIQAVRCGGLCAKQRLHLRVTQPQVAVRYSSIYTGAMPDC
jgi:hypothetical protein